MTSSLIQVSGYLWRFMCCQFETIHSFGRGLCRGLMINYLPEILINAVLLLVLIILIFIPVKTFQDMFNFLHLLKSKSKKDDRIAEYFKVSKKHKNCVTTTYFFCIICRSILLIYWVLCSWNIRQILFHNKYFLWIHIFLFDTVISNYFKQDFLNILYSVCFFFSIYLYYILYGLWYILTVRMLYLIFFTSH